MISLSIVKAEVLETAIKKEGTNKQITSLERQEKEKRLSQQSQFEQLPHF